MLMKRDEEKAKTQTPPQSRQDQEAEITSASIENAHATGDGAVKKPDELLPTDDNNETSTETTPY